MEIGVMGRGREGVRREWVKQTMEAVRRGFCDSTECGKGTWARVGLKNTGTWRRGLRNRNAEKPNLRPRVSANF